MGRYHVTQSQSHKDMTLVTQKGHITGHGHMTRIT